MTEWSRYYDAVGDDPRETLLDALDRFEAPGAAADLGCGTGRDTVELLRRGWQVVAIDSEEEAGDDERLSTQVAGYEEAVLPESDLVNASWALPFCRPELFGVVWDRIVDSIRPGGRFAGQLFGDRDEWSVEDEMTFHKRAQAEALFRVFELERFDEVEEDGETVLKNPKHWHVFHVVAHKL
jgi:tellurite methyltransferase